MKNLDKFSVMVFNIEYGDGNSWCTSKEYRIAGKENAFSKFKEIVSMYKKLGFENCTEKDDLDFMTLETISFYPSDYQVITVSLTV